MGGSIREDIKVVNGSFGADTACLIRKKRHGSTPELLHVLGEGSYVCNGDACVLFTRCGEEEATACGSGGRVQPVFLGCALDIGEESELLIADLVLLDEEDQYNK